MPRAPGAPRRSGFRVVRLIVRLALVCALVVLLALVAVRRAPAIVAAIGGSPSHSDTASGARRSAASTQGAPSIDAASPAATVSSAPVASATTGTSQIGTTQSGSGSGGGSGGGSQTVSTPAPTHATSHAPTAPTLRIDSLSAADVECPVPSSAPAAGSSASPTASITWSSTGASQAWFGIDTTDAKSNPYSQVDPDGSITVNWPCPSSSEQYAVTVQSASGSTVSRTIRVRNTGYTGSGG